MVLNLQSQSYQLRNLPDRLQSWVEFSITKWTNLLKWVHRAILIKLRLKRTKLSQLRIIDNISERQGLPPQICTRRPRPASSLQHLQTLSPVSHSNHWLWLTFTQWSPPWLKEVPLTTRAPLNSSTPFPLRTTIPPTPHSRAKMIQKWTLLNSSRLIQLTTMSLKCLSHTKLKL